jgi:predicted MFS family arabinose efflux permease
VGVLAATLVAQLGWRLSVVLLGLPAIATAAALHWFIRESGIDARGRAAAGSLRDAYRTVLADHDLRWLFVSSILGGGARGLGVLNVFVPLYLGTVLHLPIETIGLMYALLLVASVPGPIVAGRLSDQYGRRRLIVLVYVGGAASLAAFVLAGRDIPLVWVGIAALSVFSFVESPQLQALLADITPSAIRDAAYSTYFALSFGVGSMWGLLYGALVTLDPERGLTTIFWIMAGANVLAALAVLPIRRAWRPEDRVATA